MPFEAVFLAILHCLKNSCLSDPSLALTTILHCFKHLFQGQVTQHIRHIALAQLCRFIRGDSPFSGSLTTGTHWPHAALGRPDKQPFTSKALFQVHLHFQPSKLKNQEQ